MKIGSKVKLGKRLYRIQVDIRVLYFKVMVSKETNLIVPVGPGAGQIGIKSIAGSFVGWENTVLMDIATFDQATRVEAVPEAFKVLYNV